MVDGLWALRDAAFLAFIVQGGVVPSHYIRSTSERSDVVIEWAPERPWSERDSFFTLTAFRASACINPFAVEPRTYERDTAWKEITGRDARRFTALVRLLYLAQLAIWDRRNHIGLSDFNDRCRELTDGEAHRQISDPEFGDIVTTVSDRLLSGGLVIPGSTATDITVNAMGGMNSRLVGGYGESPYATEFERLLNFGN